MEEIKIYHSLWKNAKQILFCIAFTALGVYVIAKGAQGKTLFWAWTSIIFFGCGGLIIIYDLLMQHITHLPYMLITNEYVRVNVTHKKKIEIRFADVKSFYLINAKVPSTKRGRLRFSKMPQIFIGIRYKSEMEQDKLGNAATGERIIRKINSRWVGSQEHLLVVDLTLKPEEVCELLNKRVPKSNTRKKCEEQAETT